MQDKINNKLQNKIKYLYLNRTLENKIVIKYFIEQYIPHSPSLFNYHGINIKLWIKYQKLLECCMNVVISYPQNGQFRRKRKSVLLMFSSQREKIRNNLFIAECYSIVFGFIPQLTGFESSNITRFYHRKNREIKSRYE